jgi:predicted acyltransferase
MGVLQRISLTYLLAALVVLKLPRRGQWVPGVSLTRWLLGGDVFCASSGLWSG